MCLETQTEVFSWEFCELLLNSLFAEQLWLITFKMSRKSARHYQCWVAYLKKWKWKQKYKNMMFSKRPYKTPVIFVFKIHVHILWKYLISYFLDFKPENVFKLFLQKKISIETIGTFSLFLFPSRHLPAQSW